MALAPDLLLIDTAPAGQLGSMGRYGAMVEAVLSAAPCPVTCKRLRLALPWSILARLPPRLAIWLHHGWLALTAGPRLRGRHAALYHVLDGSHAYVAANLSPAQCVVTSHDVIPLLQMQGQLAGQPGRLAQRVIATSVRVARGARVVLADSRHTERDLVAVAGVPAAHIRVVHPALDPQFLGKMATARNMDGVRRQALVLHVGNQAWYKNRAGVLRIFARMGVAGSARLVMAGAPLDAVLAALARRLGVAGRVEAPGTVDDSQLQRLYGEASVFLFPSQYEGFGWPVLEAMACGCPVVCSTAAALPEVAGDAALMAAPDDEEGLAAHCRLVLSEPARAAELRDRGRRQAARFSMERMAADLQAAYGAAGLRRAD